MSLHLVHFWQERTRAAYGDVVRLEEENARLKAEVERLTSNLLGRDATIMGLDSTIKCREADVENFKEYLKWHADGHKFNAWEIWRRQKSDAGEGKQS